MARRRRRIKYKRRRRTKPYKRRRTLKTRKRKQRGGFFPLIPLGLGLLKAIGG